MFSIKIGKYYEYFLAVLIVYGNGSWLLYEKPRELNAMLCASFLLYIMFLLIRNKICLPNALAGLLIVIPVISSVLNINNKIGFASLFFTTLFSLLISVISKRAIFSILCKVAEVLFALMVVSIVLGIIFLIIPVEKVVQIHYNANIPEGYYNLLIFTKGRFLNYRAQGIFWEPGAWAVNQAFCMYWYLFQKNNKKHIPLFILSLLLTFSTTGFLLLAIILFASHKNSIIKIIRKQVVSKKMLLFYTKTVVLILAGVISVLFVLETKWKGSVETISSLISNQTVDKFTSGTPQFSSYEGRKNATYDAFKIGCAKPIFGEGRTNRIFVTSTIFQTLYQTGFAFTILYVLLFCKCFSPMGTISAIVFGLVLLNGEVMGFYSLDLIIVILGSKILFTRKYSEYYGLRFHQQTGQSSLNKSQPLVKC